jgi:hypothetical protein
MGLEEREEGRVQRDLLTNSNSDIESNSFENQHLQNSQKTIESNISNSVQSAASQNILTSSAVYTQQVRDIRAKFREREELKYRERKIISEVIKSEKQLINRSEEMRERERLDRVQQERIWRERMLDRIHSKQE